MTASSYRITLPELRRDLKLYRGPKNTDGSPSWHLYDPLQDCYYQIGWLEFLFLSLWRLKNKKLLVNTIKRCSSLSPTLAQIDHFIRFLKQNKMLVIKNGENAIADQTYSHHKNDIKQLILNYFYIKLCAFSPEGFISSTFPVIKYCFSKTFFIILLTLLFISLYLITRQWTLFINTFIYFFTLKGLLFYLFTLFAIQIFHEMGHAYAAKYHGLKVHSIGIALLFLFPVFYTDATQSWKLTSTEKRLAINSGGVIADLILAVLATFTWNFLPEGTAKSIAFFLATTSWIISLAVNLNPFIRFDGYYILSDFLEAPNLCSRSFALGRWLLRKCLLGLHIPSPDCLPRKRQKQLILYAYATWIFRIALFTGIAIFAYYRFHKLIGIILAASIMLKFILAPIYKEIRHMIRARKKLSMNKNIFFTGLTLLMLMVLFFYPWRTVIRIPATLHYSKETPLYTPMAGQIQSIQVTEGEAVKQGEVIIQLNSPDLEQSIKATHQAIDLIKWQLKKQGGKTKELGYKQPALQALALQNNKLRNLIKKQAKLSIKAPFSGIVVDLDSYLKPKMWINANTRIAYLVNPRTYLVEAYMNEGDLKRIKKGYQGIFYAHHDYHRVPVKIANIDKFNTPHLPDPYLASIYGGEIPVHLHHHQMIPSHSIYRLTLKPTKQPHPVTQVQIGSVKLKSQSHSFAHRIWTQMAAIIIRESAL